MLLHFLGFDDCDEFEAAIATLFAGTPDVTWSSGAVEDVYPTVASRTGVAFVSPANCLLFMDGGIDAVYNEVMFPGVREVLKGHMTASHPDLVTASGRPYLPIASALMVRADAAAGAYLVAAPTMCVPEDVSDTRNAFHAFMAVLAVTQLQPDVHRVVCPGLCMGWGRMKATMAAEQIHDAYMAFRAGQMQVGAMGVRHDDHCFYRAHAPTVEQWDCSVIKILNFDDE